MKFGPLLRYHILNAGILVFLSNSKEQRRHLAKTKPGVEPVRQKYEQLCLIARISTQHFPLVLMFMHLFMVTLLLTVLRSNPLPYAQYYVLIVWPRRLGLEIIELNYNLQCN